MHPSFDPSQVIDRVIQRRGRPYIFDDSDPAKTALVVVDMQNAFLMPGVAHALVKGAPEIVPNINRLAEAVRGSGGTVVWIQAAFTEETLASWSVLYAMGSPERLEARRTALTPGGIGHALWSELDCRPEDLHVEKTRYSAFAVGSSDLAEVLRRHGMDTVLITGTVTNVCCDSTARDAMASNFKTIMISDANAAVTDEDHNASLALFYLTFGDVMTTDMAIANLKRNAQQLAPALAR